MTTYERIMRIRRAVVFRWEDGIYGKCYPNSKREPITINLNRHKTANPTKTFLHELIHIAYPKATEKRVRQMETLMWRRMTAKQKFLLSRKLYVRTWRAL